MTNIDYDRPDDRIDPYYDPSVDKFMDEAIDILATCATLKDFMKKCEFLNLYAHYDEYHDEYKGKYYVVQVLIQNDILEYTFFQ